MISFLCLLLYDTEMLGWSFLWDHEMCNDTWTTYSGLLNFIPVSQATKQNSFLTGQQDSVLIWSVTCFAKIKTSLVHFNRAVCWLWSLCACMYLAYSHKCIVQCAVHAWLYSYNKNIILIWFDHHTSLISM